MIRARDYSHLRGRLIGISDRMLVQHLALYANYVKQLNAIEAAYPMTSWGPPAGKERVAISNLDAPVAKLDLEPVGPLRECVDTVLRELQGVTPFVPFFYLGDGDFWTTDGGISINIPWFLANPTLWRLANRQEGTAFTVDQVMKILRHEVGHAISYAYDLWKREDWRELFGDHTEPYTEEYRANSRSEDFVEYITEAPAHYAQKHPDEAWAEAFGAWLDPNSHWETHYAPWPKALAKLDFVDALAKTVFKTAPTNRYRGRPTPYQQVKGTVGQHLGTAQGVQPFSGIAGWSEHSELLRREPQVYDAVVLHEAYFESIGRAANPEPDGPGARAPYDMLLAGIGAAWGSVESYMLDLRAIAGSTSGWALTVWDPRAQRVRNALVEQHHIGVPAGCPILLAIDCWEHAYTADYGIRKDIYLAAVFENIDWRMVVGRYAIARGDEPIAVQAELSATSPDAVFDRFAEGLETASRAGVGARFASRGSNLVAVEKDVKRGDKTHRQIYWVKPDVAERLKQEGKVRDPSPEALAAAEERAQRTVATVTSPESRGGFSFRPSGKEIPDDGFMVSREPEDGMGSVLDLSAVEDEEGIEALVEDWVKSHLDFIEGGDNRYFGGFAEMKGDKAVAFHLDVSENVADRSEAEQLGKDRNQISVWDVKNFEEVKTGGTGRLDRGKQVRPPGWWRDDE